MSNLTILAVAAMLFPPLRRTYGEERLKSIGRQLVLPLAYGFVVLIGMLALVAVASRAAWPDRPRSRCRCHRKLHL